MPAPSERRCDQAGHTEPALAEALVGADLANRLREVSIQLYTRARAYARDRGIMAMAIFGNVITALSWFGVNMLGVGLHSYGFIDSAFLWLISFVLFHLAIMGMASVSGFSKPGKEAPRG